MNLLKEAIQEFSRNLEIHKSSDAVEPTAMQLATAGKAGHPSVRTVLLKEFSERGFVFYTNSNSRKGQQLNDNPNAALCLYWPEAGKQVTIEGSVEMVTKADADAYWASRLRESQIGGWASHQSHALDNREELMKKYKKVEKEYEGKTIPRPPYWNGYRLLPNRIEFWEARPYRLHNRTVYQKTKKGWTIGLVNP